MNWKLMLGLSLFGLVMAIATVYVIPTRIEVYIWLPIYLLCAYLVQKYAPSKLFLHGFLVSILNSVWVTCLHITLSDTYLSNHPLDAASFINLDSQYGIKIWQAMVFTGTAIGVVSGVFLGLFVLVMDKIFRGRY